MADQELLCSLDWLGLSLRMEGEPLPLAGHAWVEYSSTNVWRKRRVLWNDHGERVCTLLSEPIAKIIDPHAALLEIENEWLYHGLGPEGVLALLRGSFSFEVVGISRLDLCCDFNPTATQAEIIEGLWAGRYYVKSKQNGSDFWSTPQSTHLHPMWRGRRIQHQLSWGHKTTAIRWKLYYKTKELWDAGGDVVMHKPYIVDQWRQYGLDTSNVWRLEVSMKHLNDYKLYGQQIGMETLAASRVALWCDMYNSRFTIRRNEGHKDKSNDEIVEFLPVPTVDTGFCRNEPTKHRERNGRITLLRHLITSLEDEHVLLDEPTRNDVLQHIYSIIERDGLDNYFLSMTGHYFDDFAADVDTRAREMFAQRVDIQRDMRTENYGKYREQQLVDVPRADDLSYIQPNRKFDPHDWDGRQLGLEF